MDLRGVSGRTEVNMIKIYACPRLHAYFCGYDPQHDKKKHGDERVSFPFHIPVHPLGKSVRNLQAGAEIETVKELVCSLWLVQLALLYNLELCALRWHHPPISIINQENTLTGLPTVIRMEEVLPQTCLQSFGWR